ncbi:MAG: GspH/FimT family pseudopilin [Betaproteobacteria bacterium]
MDNFFHAVLRGPSRGFTLIELIVSVALLGALLALAPAAYGDWMASQQLANHARLLTETLDLARSEAIKHGYRVNVCKSSNGRRCDDRAGWEAGWVMFVDENRDGEIDDEQQIIRREGAAPAQITLAANRPVADYVSYTSLGHARLLSGALQMGTFVVCKPGQNAIKVVLANSGRARMEKTRDRCA